MDNEIMESVLTEILEEQKAGAMAIRELNTSIITLARTIDSFQKRPVQQTVTASPVDTKVIQEMLADGISKIQETIARQPKNITRNFRLLLFPEMYAETYYRIVFGRLLFWMIIFLMATYLFALGKQGIESWQDVKEKEVEANHSLKAWRYLYQHEKSVRTKMDIAWFKSW